jgi:hypothetical protein
MSIDPYHAVQQEIQNSLHTAAQLQSSFLRIRSMANTDSEELMWARNEVRSFLPTNSSFSLKLIHVTPSSKLHSQHLKLISRIWKRVSSKCFAYSTLPQLTGFFLFFRIVESTDARMFGLDEAEVQKRRRYVGHVRKEIEVRSCFLTLGKCSLFATFNFSSFLSMELKCNRPLTISSFASPEHESNCVSIYFRTCA